MGRRRVKGGQFTRLISNDGLRGKSVEWNVLQDIIERHSTGHRSSPGGEEHPTSGGGGKKEGGPTKERGPTMCLANTKYTRIIKWEKPRSCNLQGVISRIKRGKGEKNERKG